MTHLALALLSARQLATLSWPDILILLMYFVLVIFIGFYVKDSANTSEEFFLAGREMTAWIAGLSFVSANLGSLELMGWAGTAYQYGLLATHWYWIGAIPAMLFLGIVMMPFYYISKTHSVPGYLQLRFGEGARAVSAVTFGVMTVLMSGVNMYSMALVMKVVLGWDINFSIWVGAFTVGLYVMLGGLRSAIINEVLQFVLIWAGAALVPILGLIEAGGWTNLKHQIAAQIGNDSYMHLWANTGTFQGNAMGIHWTGLVFGLGFVISFGYWTTDFLVVQRVLSAN
ncbi:MAG: Na+/galactose cotransporter, partial [Acidobacteriaceae bacterium]|nr:Na+/galactose cotransporter [Acidobacteriaceae bacterium]